MLETSWKVEYQCWGIMLKMFLHAQMGGEVVLRVLRSTRFPNLCEVHMSMVEVDEAGVEFLNAICSDSASALGSLMLPSASISTLRFLGPAVALHSLDLTGEIMHNWATTLLDVNICEEPLHLARSTSSLLWEARGQSHTFEVCVLQV